MAVEFQNVMDRRRRGRVKLGLYMSDGWRDWLYALKIHPPSHPDITRPLPASLEVESKAGFAAAAAEPWSMRLYHRFVYPSWYRELRN